MNLALIILAAVLNLFHEVPDNEEEVGAEHPPKDAEHNDGGAEVESSQDHPRLHEAGVPRSGAVDEASRDHGGED